MKTTKYPEYIKNPFRVKGITERTFTKKGMELHDKAMVDPDTGEAVPLYTMPKQQVVMHDSKSYVKVFMDTGDLVRELSPAATKVYLYVIFNMRINYDLVYLNAADVCEWAGFSGATFYRAVEELLNRKFIARKLGSYLEYWIDPNIFYNGDRVKLFKHLKQNINSNE